MRDDESARAGADAVCHHSQVHEHGPCRFGALGYYRHVAISERRVAPDGALELDDATAAVCLFRSLADPARLALLRHLALGEHRVVELTRHLGLAQSTVSGHLACLRDCGLVTSRPQGRASMYSLARPEVLDLFAAAERVLAATGSAVALCPTYGVGAAR